MLRKIITLIGTIVGIGLLGIVYIMTSTRVDYVGFNAVSTESIEMNVGVDVIEQTIASRYDIEQIMIWAGSSEEDEEVLGTIQGEIVDTATGEILGVAECIIDTELEEVDAYLNFGEPLDTQFRTVTLVLTLVDNEEGAVAIWENENQNEKLSCVINGEAVTENLVFGIYANNMLQSAKQFCIWVAMLIGIAAINWGLYIFYNERYVIFMKKWTKKDTYRGFFQKIWNYRSQIYWLLGEVVLMSVIEWYRVNNITDETFFMGKVMFYVAVIEIIKVLVSNCIKKIYTVESVYLIISIAIGGLIACYFPITSVSWDDQIHYDRTIQVCEFFGFTTSLADRAKIELYIDDLNNYDILANNELFNELDETYGPLPFRSAAQPYQLVGYIPYAIGMMIGSFLGLSFAWTVAFSKLMNVIACSVIIYYAIKRVKTGKLLLAGIALLPTNMFLMGVYSYDVWVTACLMLAIAYIMGALEEPDKLITKKEIGIILGAFFLGLGPKAIYFPMILIALVIPKKKFESDKCYKRFLLLVGVVTISVFADVILANMSSAVAGDTRGGSDISGKDQIIYIISNPWEYTKTLLGFMSEYFGISTLRNNITSYAYMKDISYSNWYLVALGVSVFLDKQEEDKYIGTWKVRTITWGMVFAAMSLAMTALYIAYTPVGADSINGFQPRYMIPILYPALVLLPKFRLSKYIQHEVVTSILFAIMSFVSLAGIWFIFGQYVL